MSLRLKSAASEGEMTLLRLVLKTSSLKSVMGRMNDEAIAQLAIASLSLAMTYLFEN